MDLRNELDYRIQATERLKKKLPLKKKLIIALIIVLVPVLIWLFFYIPQIPDYHYSKKLVSAIREENIVEVQRLVEEKPTCINTVPTLLPKIFYSLADVPAPKYPLGEACLVGNVEIVEMMVEHGADVNLDHISKFGSTLSPLSLTYFQKPKNWYNTSLYLLENGASLDYKSHHSEDNVLIDIVASRPGKISVEEGEEDNTEVVLSFHYALENCDHSKINWMRVISQSVIYDRIEIVKLLLDDGYCDVNDTSVGMTVLMFAARSSTPEMVKLLLDYGADKSIKTSDGKTAYDYAVENGKGEEMISLLR